MDSAPALARAAGLSLHHFGRECRRALGVSPRRYWRELRLQQARRLWRGTALRVNEVAREVGLADPLHFTRLFGRAAGVSPTRFRRLVPERNQAALSRRRRRAGNQEDG